MLYHPHDALFSHLVYIVPPHRCGSGAEHLQETRPSPTPSEQKVYILLLELPGVCVTAAACWGEGPAVRAPDAQGAVMQSGS